MVYLRRLLATGREMIALQPRLAVDADLRRTAGFGASVLGYAVAGFVVWWTLVDRGALPPDLGVWYRVGDQALRGVSPYALADLTWTGFFFYAPPWAFLLAPISFLPPQALWALIFAVELLSLRYIAGSWLRVGYFGLVPVTGLELGNGSFNLIVAASIAAAMRGDGRLAAWMSLAKFSPLLAVRDFKRAAAVLGIAFLVTLPVLSWWGDWVNLLLWTNEHVPIGFQIPWPVRLALAIAIVIVVRRPWARGLAAAIAIPAMYVYSIVLLYPVVMELLRERGASERSPAPPATSPASRMVAPAVGSARLTTQDSSPSARC